MADLATPPNCESPTNTYLLAIQKRGVPGLAGQDSETGGAPFGHPFARPLSGPIWLSPYSSLRLENLLLGLEKGSVLESLARGQKKKVIHLELI